MTAMTRRAATGAVAPTVMVVDASAVIDALTLPPGSGPVAARLAAGDLHAPAALDDAVAAGAGLLVAGGCLSAARAYALLDDYDDLPLRRWPAARPLRERALQLAPTAGTRAPWVALAQALGAPLVTREAALARTCGHLVAVELL